MLARSELKQIGLVAQESGLPIKTIRYYDDLGLLKSSSRSAGNYRLFSADVFGRLRFIKRAQSLGLSLVEIKEFLSVHDRGDLPCNQIKAKLTAKLEDIEQKIQQLQILKQELSGLLSGWETIPDRRAEEKICPIIERT